MMQAMERNMDVLRGVSIGLKIVCLNCEKAGAMRPSICRLGGHKDGITEMLPCRIDIEIECVAYRIELI